MNNELIYCIQAGDVEGIKDMITNGFDIKPDLQDALVYAANQSKINVVKYLVGIGAEVAYDDNRALKCAALIKSPYYGNLEVIEYLVNHGADVKAIEGTLHPIVQEWVKTYLALYYVHK